MTALSSANLYQPKLVGTAQLERLDDFIWPTYRRVTLEQGGDHYAEFQISIEDHNVTTAQLEQWFLNWIGCHFEESYGGVIAFAGYVHSLRIYVGGVMRQITLDDMYNHVRVTYTPSSIGAYAITSAATDTDSSGKYGTRQLIHDTAPDYIKQTHAEAIRDNLLDWHKSPRSTSGDLVTSDGSAALEVYIQGYGHTLSWEYYQLENESAADTTISSHISSTLLSGRDFVTAGNIATVSTSITDESDYQTYLQRIAALLENSDYQWGCFGGSEFTVTARDTTNIKYRRQAYGDRFGFRRGGRYVPEPLITPGGWLYTEDIFAGSGPDAADYRDDPRADWLHTIEYSIDGITATNPTWQREAEAFAVANAIGETAKTERQMWVDRAIFK